MLSLFPSLLTWQEISPLMIRVVLGAIFIFIAYRVFVDKSAKSTTKVVAIIEFISGALILVGLWTQLAAMVIAIDLIIRIAGKIKTKSFLTDGVNYYVLLLVMSLSLIVTGAGFLAFDYPL